MKTYSYEIPKCRERLLNHSLKQAFECGAYLRIL